MRGTPDPGLARLAPPAATRAEAVAVLGSLSLYVGLSIAASEEDPQMNPIDRVLERHNRRVRDNLSQPITHPLVKGPEVIDVVESPAGAIARVREEWDQSAAAKTIRRIADELTWPGRKPGPLPKWAKGKATHG